MNRRVFLHLFMVGILVGGVLAIRSPRSQCACTEWSGGYMIYGRVSNGDPSSLLLDDGVSHVVGEVLQRVPGVDGYQYAVGGGMADFPVSVSEVNMGAPESNTVTYAAANADQDDGVYDTYQETQTDFCDFEVILDYLIVGIPVENEYNLTVDAYVRGDGEAINVRVWNYTRGGWDVVGMVVNDTITEYRLDAVDHVVGQAVNMSLVDTVNDQVVTILSVDFVRVDGHSALVPYAFATLPDYTVDGAADELYHFLEIDYAVTGDAESIDVEIYNWSSAGWFDAGDINAGTPTPFNYTVSQANGLLNASRGCSVRFADQDADATPTTLSVDYVRVHARTPPLADYGFSPYPDYAVTGLPVGYSWYELQIEYNVVDIGGEDLVIQVWDDPVNTTRGTITTDGVGVFAHNLTANERAGNDCVVRFVDSDTSTDATSTTLEVDYVRVYAHLDATYTEDPVDNDTSDVGGPSDLGVLSNFANMQGFGTTYATVTESDEGSAGFNLEDFVDQISNLHAPTDIGTHSSFTELQDRDGTFDTLTEEDTLEGDIVFAGSAEGYSAIGASSHSYSYSLQSGSGNSRLLVAGSACEDNTGTTLVSQIRFNGVDMVNVDNATTGGIGYANIGSLWYLLDADLPASAGSYTLSITYTQPIEREIYLAVAEYTGVNQGPPDASDTGVNTAPGAVSFSLSGVPTGSEVVAIVGEGGTNALTNLNNLTNLQEQILTSSGAAFGNYTDAGGSGTYGWNNLATRSCVVGAAWSDDGGGVSYELDLEVGWTSADYDEANEELCVFGGAQGAESLRVDVWTGSWTNLDADLSAGWNNYSVSAYLTAATFEIRFTDTSGDAVLQDAWQVEGVLLHTWTDPSPNYRVDQELQWTGVGYSDDNEYLCLFMNSTGAESIEVDVWTGAWTNIAADLLPDQWNNISVASYLTGATLTIRLVDAIVAGDPTQDSWAVNVGLLQTSNNSASQTDYTAEGNAVLDDGVWDTYVEQRTAQTDLLQYTAEGNAGADDSITDDYSEFGSDASDTTTYTGQGSATADDGSYDMYSEDAPEWDWVTIPTYTLGAIPDEDQYNFTVDWDDGSWGDTEMLTIELYNWLSSGWSVVATFDDTNSSSWRLNAVDASTYINGNGDLRVRFDDTVLDTTSTTLRIDCISVAGHTDAVLSYALASLPTYEVNAAAGQAQYTLSVEYQWVNGGGESISIELWNFIAQAWEDQGDFSSSVYVVENFSVSVANGYLSETYQLRVRFSDNDRTDSDTLQSTLDVNSVVVQGLPSQSGDFPLILVLGGVAAVAIPAAGVTLWKFGPRRKPETQESAAPAAAPVEPATTTEVEPVMAISGTLPDEVAKTLQGIDGDLAQIQRTEETLHTLGVDELASTKQSLEEQLQKYRDTLDILADLRSEVLTGHESDITQTAIKALDGSLRLVNLRVYLMSITNGVLLPAWLVEQTGTLKRLKYEELVGLETTLSGLLSEYMALLGDLEKDHAGVKEVRREALLLEATLERINWLLVKKKRQKT